MGTKKTTPNSKTPSVINLVEWSYDYIGTISYLLAVYYREVPFPLYSTTKLGYFG